MRNYLDFSEKVVLVTGSTRNIGKAIAELFAEHGATVIINSRHSEDVERTVAEFRNHGYRADGIAADVGDETAVRAMVAEIVKRCGRIDTAVNNAASRPFDSKSFLADEETLHETLKTNVVGTFNVSRRVAEVMKEQKSGSIISISSSAAIDGSDITGLDYIMSKGAILSLTRGLAKELGSFGVRVNAVIPRYMLTERDWRLDDEMLKGAAENTLLKRLGSPKEVASVCLFLASDMASFVTGEFIALGGTHKFYI
ncbi:MAG: SDR family oxidoreductase [Candidatus Sungiibacteriota bacterium]